MAANAQGTDSPLSHLAHGAQLPRCPTRRKAQAGSSGPPGASRPRASPAGAGQFGGMKSKVLPQCCHQPQQTRKRPLGPAASRVPLCGW